MGRELARRSLRHYMKQMWHVVEPTTPFVGGWHLDAICDHLQAVKAGIKNPDAVGAIRKLIINVPPRMTKSLTVSVGLPTWVWIDQPSFRSIHTSYSEDLSVRDSVKSRAVIQSPWYQRNWGHLYRLSGDVNLKTRFENDKTGFRLATSVAGMATGEGGDGIFIDDPHNVKDTLGTSERSLQEVADWFDFVLQTRLNDQKTGFIILIMQRVHHRDLTGHILAKELGYEHLCLPMEYEANHPHLWAADPRSIEGELLCPDRMGPAEVKTLKKSLRDYGSAGQLQQRPAPREGGMIKRHFFQVVGQAPRDVEKRLRWWDMAATEKRAGNNPDFTAGARLSMTADGVCYVEHVVAEREGSLAVEKVVKETAKLDGGDVDIWMEQEPGSSGKTVINSYSRKLSGLGGYKFRGETSGRHKEAYVELLAAAMESGTVMWVRGPWLEGVIEQACSFPNADHDDEIEAVAKAYCKLATRIKSRSRVPGEETADVPAVGLAEQVWRALEAVKNAGGQATTADFIEWHEPAGGRLWNDLEAQGLVAADVDGMAILTPAGREALERGIASDDELEAHQQAVEEARRQEAADEDVDWEAVAEANARRIYGDAVVTNWSDAAARGID